MSNHDDTKQVSIDALIDELESWQKQKDERCALVVCGYRDKDGEMQRATLILGSKHDMAEVLRNEFDDPDGIFARRLEIAGITAK